MLKRLDSKLQAEKVFIPRSLICPLSRRVYNDPVLTPSGNSFERTHVVRWIEEKGVDPVSGEKLCVEQLVDNYALKMAAEEYSEEILPQLGELKTIQLELDALKKKCWELEAFSQELQNKLSDLQISNPQFITVYTHHTSKSEV